METLSKYDVLLYLSQIEAPDKKELIKYLNRNIHFENVSDRKVSSLLNVLKKEKLISRMTISTENPKASECLAFLYWAKMKGRDYNKLLDKKPIRIYKELFENSQQTLKDLMKKTGLSKPTLVKYINILVRNKFVCILKKKPLVLKANLNDLSFFYANYLDFSFAATENQYTGKTLPKIRSKKLIDATIKLHVHSTTVTEGNTATEHDVERVFADYPVNLTPREITEILNARSAINHLFSICKDDITIASIKRLHAILTTSILDRPGEFLYSTKKIAGFDTKLPSSKQEIDYSTAALISFTRKGINPLVLGPITHFIFASIHPFADGNGRMARLLHSWILLKAGYPLLVFDPKKRNEYFNHLESGRFESIDNFISFCITEHISSLKKITEK